MPVDVRLPTVLRQHAGGQASVQANGSTLGEVFEDLLRQFPLLKGQRMLMAIWIPLRIRLWFPRLCFAPAQLAVPNCREWSGEDRLSGGSDEQIIIVPAFEHGAEGSLGIDRVPVRNGPIEGWRTRSRPDLARQDAAYSLGNRQAL